MKYLDHVDQLKVLQDLLKIKETDGVLRLFWNSGSGYYTIEGYWYFPTEGKEDLYYSIEKAVLDRLVEAGEIKLYRSENSKAIHDLEITERGEVRLARLLHDERSRGGFSVLRSEAGYAVLA